MTARASSKKDTNSQLINIAELEHEIVKFDRVLECVLRYFPEDTRIWDSVANSRDALFRLQQSLHGLDVIDFTSAFERPCWWVENFEEEARNGEEAAS